MVLKDQKYKGKQMKDKKLLEMKQLLEMSSAQPVIEEAKKPITKFSKSEIMSTLKVVKAFGKAMAIVDKQGFVEEDFEILDKVVQSDWPFTSKQLQAIIMKVENLANACDDAEEVLKHYSKTGTDVGNHGPQMPGYYDED